MVAALERGECDGILPAASGWLDEFGTFCVENHVPELLALLPDARARCSIPAALLGTVLLYKQLLRIPCFAQMGRVLFRSPALLRQMGFNWRQANDGFYAGEGRTPFDEEALADFFAGIDRDDLWAFQQRMLPALVEQCPELLGEGMLAMDCITVTVPAGHRQRAGGKYKACVLMSYRDGCLYPLLCLFGDEHTADLTLGQALMDALLELLPEQHWTLLLDRGFIDGEWIGQLAGRGVDVVIGVRSDMNLFDDALGLARLPDTKWRRVKPPQYHEGERPRRFVTGWHGLESWSSCPVPLSVTLIKDRFSDKTEHSVVASTKPLGPVALHERFRQRWQIEEAFMALTRYWNIDKLGSCRHAVYLAQVYFTLLAYALVRVYCNRHDGGAPDTALAPGRELVVYWRDRYAILYPSELFEIVFAHRERWQTNQAQLLAAMRYCEGRPPPQ